MSARALCDRSRAIAQTSETPRRRPLLVLGVCILASSLDYVDGSVVNVGLPAIGRSLIAGAVLVAIGVGLTLLIGRDAPFWTRVLPSVLILALGMACAAAPLTAAVLGAVDAAHTGVASGLNSAVAQLGGVVTNALIGGVLARRGAALIDALHLAALCGAAMAEVAAAAIALLFSTPPPRPPSPNGS